MPKQSLASFPVALFASVMGLGGVALAWRRASRVWDVPEWPYQVFFGLGVLALVVVTVAYLAKIVAHPAAVLAEVRHPVTLAFVPTVTIAILVMATAAEELVPGTALVAWWIGAVGHLAATVAVVTAWSVRSDVGPGHVTPAWFIPVVGNVVTPLAVPDLGSVELAWFAFGVGMVFWIGLLPLLLQRVLSHGQPLPAPLLPTYAIFIAPPSVAMLSWQALTGRVDDPVTRVLWATALMFVVLLAAQLPRLRKVPFGLTHWSLTFPLAAAAAASVAVAGGLDGWAYDVVAVALLAAATLVVLVVLALTLNAWRKGRLFVPPPGEPA